MKCPRFAIKPKIVKILALLALVAVVKLTVLGAVGLDLWRELADEDLLPIPQALAATKSAKAAKTKKAEEIPPAVAPDAVTQEDNPGGSPEMLAQNAVPAANVGESREARSANAREAELASRERALTAMEKSIDDKLAELKKVEASIKKLLDQADVLKDERIKRQVATYQAMKPKQAAEVLSNMDQDLAVKILTGMKPKVAGEIMTYVKTDKAAKLTEAMTKIQAQPPMPGQ
jgi:flagellar motility protein MotE (MotC chaperone)